MSALPKVIPALRAARPITAVPEADQSFDVAKVVLFFILNLGLAVVMSRVRMISVLHCHLVFVIGLYYCVVNRRPDMVACVAGYIAGGEVLWRMTKGNLIWEWAKYAIVALMFIGLICFRKTKTNVLATTYFALLIPSAFVTLTYLPFDVARKEISFVLSGPFSLFMSVWFFGNLTLAPRDVIKMLMALGAPLVGTAAVTIAGIVSARNLVFVDESNFQTSGGFGPNQVSSVLGMGAFALFVVTLYVWKNVRLRFFFLAMMCLCIVQAALTLSRGGLYGAVGAIAVASFFFFLFDGRIRPRIIVLVAMALVLLFGLVLPRVNEFTGGMMARRFSDTDLANRDTIVQADFWVWQRYPVFGLGAGMSKFVYKWVGETASHTEYTRFFSEHGSFGIVSLVCLIIMAIQPLFKAKTPLQRGVSAGGVAWAALYMSNAAMRLAAPGFMFGLAAISIGAAAPKAVKAVRRVVRRVPAPVSAIRPVARPISPGAP